jgi:DNA polymerase-3 subunit delta
MVIFLYGPDTYRIGQKLKELKNKFIRQKDKSGLGITVLDSQSLALDTFRSRLYAPGFFSDKRMIIIENLLAGAGQQILEETLEYLKKVRQEKENITVFVERGTPVAKQDLQKKLFNLLKKAEHVQEFSLFSGARLNQWIKKEIVKRGGKIAGPAVNVLAAATGPDLWRLSSEIDKLIAYCGIYPITSEAVNLLVKARLDENIFHLVDAVGMKDKKSALKFLKDQLAAGISLNYLFGMLVRQFRILLQVRELLSRGDSSQWSLAKKLGLHPYVAKKSLIQARRFTKQELEKIYQKLLAIDVKRKTTPVDPGVLIDLLIVSV